MAATKVGCTLCGSTNIRKTTYEDGEERYTCQRCGGRQWSGEAAFHPGPAPRGKRGGGSTTPPPQHAAAAVTLTRDDAEVIRAALDYADSESMMEDYVGPRAVLRKLWRAGLLDRRPALLSEKE